MTKTSSGARQRYYRGSFPISNMYLQGKTREEYTRPWQDHPLGALVFALWKFSEKGTMWSYEDFESIIGWKRRTVKSMMEEIKGSKLKILLRSKMMETPIGRRKKWWLMKEASNLTFLEIMQMVRPAFKNKEHNRNKCEDKIFKILEKEYPGQWKWTGERCLKNRILNFYPDFRNEEEKKIIEHFGSPYHNVDEEINRTRALNQAGYDVLVIWDADKLTENEIKRRIRTFLEETLKEGLRDAI
jgi:very-short-patch-repair endonuclease